MSDAAGMATIMLMPGDNADQHWIWALPTDRVSEGMFSDRVAGDATSFTMSGLTSGMSYWFTAVAGRGDGRRRCRSGLRTAAGPLRPPSSKQRP